MDSAPWCRRQRKRAEGLEAFAEPVLEPTIGDKAEEPKSPSSEPALQHDTFPAFPTHSPTEEAEPTVPVTPSPTSPAERTCSPESLSSHPTLIPGFAWPVCFGAFPFGDSIFGNGVLLCPWPL